MDPDARRCLNLWAAMLATTIRDACLKPIKVKIETTDEDTGKTVKKKIIRMSDHARNAMLYLTDPTSSLDHILGFFDIDSEQFRRRLIESMHSEQTVPYFEYYISDSRRRGFRYNWQAWKHESQFMAQGKAAEHVRRIAQVISEEASK